MTAFGNQREIIDRIFVVGVGIRNHSRQRCLAPRPGGSGNRHQRGQLSVYLQEPPHLLHRLPGLRDPRPCRLGTVYGGTTAESDDGVAMVGQVGFFCLFHIVDRRVLYGIVVDGIGHARLLQGICQRLQQAQPGNPFVRDDQDALFSLLGQDAAQIFHVLQDFRLPVWQDGKRHPEAELECPTVNFPETIHN